MSRPRNWYEMSDSQRRDWQRQDNERSDLEDAKEKAERQAAQASRDAQRAQEAAKSARYEYEENAESYRGEIESLNERLTEARLQRDALLAGCKAAMEARDHASAFALDDRMKAAFDLIISAVKDAEENPA